jgi:glutamate carboxypeptidase
VKKSSPKKEIGDSRSILPEPTNRLHGQCLNRKGTLLEELERYVNIDSGSQNEPGLKEFQQLLMARLKALGAEVECVEVNRPQAGYNIAATFRGRGKGTVLMLAHADTVFPDGTAKARPFRIEGNRAYGPGIADDKGGLVLGLHALSLLRKNDFQDFERITFMINPDEEKSSLESRDMIRALARSHQYALSLEPGKPDDAIVNWRKGSGRLTMEVFGRSSHAGSAPQKGRNATMELAHQLIQLDGKLDDSAKMTTVNWTVLERTQTPHNVIPDYAAVLSSVRVLYPEEWDRLLKDAEKISQNRLIPDTRVQFKLFVGRPPFPKNEGTDRLSLHLQKIYADELGLRLGVNGTGGAGDANHTADVGAITVDGLGIVGDNIHSSTEWIDVDSIVPRLYLLTRIVMDLGSGKF